MTGTGRAEKGQPGEHGAVGSVREEPEEIGGGGILGGE